MNKYLFLFSCFCLYFSSQLQAQCSPDITPPTLTVPECGGSFTTTISNGSAYLDELSWELLDIDNNIVASHGGYSSSAGDTQTDIVSNGPFTFHIETLGIFGDNEADYEIVCNGYTLLLGHIYGSQDTTFANICLGIHANSTMGTCGGAVTYTTTTTDACSTPTVTADHNSGDVFPVGTTLVTVTSTDVANNSVMKSFTITVADTEAPSITCPPTQMLALDNQGNATLPDYTALATATDLCPGSVSITQDPPAGTTVIGSGITPVTLTATDEAGNMTDCTFDVSHILNTPTISITSPLTNNDSLTTCIGTIVTLIAPPASEYLWFKDGVAINYSLDSAYNVPAIAGTSVYTVQVVYPNTSVLSVESAPVYIIGSPVNATLTVTGPTTLCQGSMGTSLNAVANAGYTYSWMRSTTILQTGASATYIPTTSGNHAVKVTNTTTGCSKASPWTSILVKALPSANAGADKIICQGTSVQIGAGSVGGNTYTWSPTTALANPYIANPTSSALNNITYTLTVHNNTTGCNNTDAVILTSAAVPNIPALSTTATPVCQGSSIVITPTAIGASSVDWYKNGVFLYNKALNFAQTISSATASADIYSIKGKGANGCPSSFSNTISAWVKEAALPVITSMPAAVGSTITVCVPNGTTGSATLTANVASGTPSYIWRLAGSIVPNANTNTYMQTVTLSQNNKVVSVEAAYTNGCTRASSSRTVKLVTANCFAKMGTGEFENLEPETLSMSAYPNPAHNELNVAILHCEVNVAKLVLYNTLGQVMMEKIISVRDGAANEILDISGFPAGIYLLTLPLNGPQLVQKVVKE